MFCIYSGRTNYKHSPSWKKNPCLHVKIFSRLKLNFWANKFSWTRYLVPKVGVEPTRSIKINGFWIHRVCHSATPALGALGFQACTRLDANCGISILATISTEYLFGIKIFVTGTKEWIVSDVGWKAVCLVNYVSSKRRRNLVEYLNTRCHRSSYKSPVKRLASSSNYLRHASLRACQKNSPATWKLPPADP